LLLFCYIYSVRKELKSYLINENLQHIEKSKKFFKSYFNIFVHDTYKDNDKSINIRITKLIDDIQEKHGWIEFSEDTYKILKALSSTEKISERLNQILELEAVVKTIDYLILYEFAKIKKDELTPDGTKLELRKKDYLLSFATGINEINQIDPLPEISPKKKICLKGLLFQYPPYSIAAIFLFYS
jgi:hypothetical protein